MGGLKERDGDRVIAVTASGNRGGAHLELACGDAHAEAARELGRLSRERCTDGHGVGAPGVVIGSRLGGEHGAEALESREGERHGEHSRAVVGARERRHQQLPLRAARAHALLEKIGYVDARREADDGHRRVLGLHEVVQRIQQLAGVKRAAKRTASVEAVDAAGGGYVTSG